MMNLWSILRNSKFRDELADSISYEDEPWAKQSWRQAYNARNDLAVADDLAAQQSLGLNEHAALARDWVNSDDTAKRLLGRYAMPFMVPTYDLAKVAARNGLPSWTGPGRVEPGLDSMAAGYKGWLTGMADMLRKR